MEFGYLENISNVDWSLPAESSLTSGYLQSLPTNGKAVFIGAPAWGHAVWKGKIYPEKAKSTEFLYHYSRSFSCIELNTSHYRIPTESQTKKWLEQTPQNFRYCPKVYQGISHSEEGLINKELLREWLLFLESLGENRGPSFLQLPPHFDYSRKHLLFDFLKSWPKEYDLALEFRHPSWFQKGQILPALVKYLQSRGLGLVITDVAGRRDVVHTSISAPFVILRFIGNNLHSTDFQRAERWIEKFNGWFSLGLQRLFLMVHEPDDISAPEMARFFIEKLNALPGIKHAPIKDLSLSGHTDTLPGF